MRRGAERPSNRHLWGRQAAGYGADGRAGARTADRPTRRLPSDREADHAGGGPRRLKATEGAP
ncbi:hypothetical protein Sm713_58050 [Streptomyces sp. TS71-3]|nr:hypothetical protein Sm713_58050 [Streptomyces sp. TS71-3]